MKRIRIRSAAALAATLALSACASAPAITHSAASAAPHAHTHARHLRAHRAPHVFSERSSNLQALAGLPALAAAYWNATPTCRYTVSYSTDSYANANYDGLASWASSTECSITLNPRFKDVTESDQLYPVLCKVFLHEYGHLLGYSHTSDVNDVMYGPTLTVPEPSDQILAWERIVPSACSQSR